MQKNRSALRSGKGVRAGSGTTMRGYVAAALCIGAAVFASAQAQTATPVATAGQYSVSPNGAGTYTVPIQVPPGIAGIEPKLSLNYNSQGGNGVMGVGWSLSGLSAITRCPQTRTQDGLGWVSGVNIATTDRYCMDGQRLVAIKDPSNSSSAVGTYGGDGTYYDTEQAGFNLVISHTTSDVPNGPKWFEVKTKSGLTLEYGNTTDSRIEAAGLTAVRVWALNKVKDANGNYLTITYQENTTTGEYYPAEIDYTANDGAGITAASSVVFEYNNGSSTPRSDIGTIDSYMPGVPHAMRNTVLLTKVTTKTRPVAVAGAAAPSQVQVKQYQLQYESALSPTSGRLRLHSVQECGGPTAGTCLNPTVFTWQGTTLSTDNKLTMSQALTGIPCAGSCVSFSNIGFSGGNWRWSLPMPFIAADVDGDGVDELVWPRWYLTGSTIAPMTVDVVKKTASGWSRVNWIGSVAGSTSFSADVNARGGSNWSAKLSATQTDYSNWLPVQPVYLTMDADGDGKTDLIVVRNDTGNAASIDVYRNGSSTPTTWVSQQGTFDKDRHWYVADMDGDGRPDIVHVFNSGGNVAIDVYLNTNGTSFTRQNWVTSGGGYDVSNGQFFVADFSGDGLPDVGYVYYQSGGTYVGSDGYYHTTTPGYYINVFQNINPSAPTAAGASHVLSSHAYLLWVWNGDINFPNPADTVNPTTRWYVADVNGDGLPDVVRIFNGSGTTDPTNDQPNGTVSVDVFVNYMYGHSAGFVAKHWITQQGSWYNSALQSFYLVDMNGDGRADLVTVKAPSMQGQTSIETSIGLALIKDETSDLQMTVLINDGQFQTGGYPGATWQSTGVNKFRSLQVSVGSTSQWMAPLSNAITWRNDGSGKPGFSVMLDAVGGGSANLDLETVSWATQDWVQYFVDGLNGYYEQLVEPVLLPSARSTSGTDVPYKPGTTALTWPLVSVAPSMQAVTAFRSGTSNTYSHVTTYDYGAAAMDASGRGYLGFGWIQSNDTSGVSTRTTYLQSFPFTGSIAKTEVMKVPGDTSTVIKRSQSTYSCLNLTALTTLTSDQYSASGCSGDGRYFVYPSVVQESSWDLDGSAMGTTKKTSSGLDAFGNVSQSGVEVDNVDGSVARTQTTTNLYRNDATPSNWKLGRLIKSTTTTTQP